MSGAYSRGCQDLPLVWCKTAPGADFLLGTLPPIVSILVIVVLVWQIVIARDQNSIAQKQTDIAQEQVEETKRKRVEAEKVLDEAREVKQKAEGLLSDAETFKKQSEEELASIQMRTENLQEQMEVLNSEIDTTTQKMESSLASFEQKQHGLSTEVVALKEELSGEIVILKARNEITDLSNRALAGEAAAFDELNDRLKAAEINTPEHTLIEASVLDVKQFYLTTDRIANASFSAPAPDGTIVADKDMDTTILIEALKNHDSWIVRAKAAKLLGERKEVGVPEALITGLDDERLDVRRNCVRSFHRLFKDSHPDALKGWDIKEWWNNNKEAKLSELQGDNSQ